MSKRERTCGALMVVVDAGRRRARAQGPAATLNRKPLLLPKYETTVLFSRHGVVPRMLVGPINLRRPACRWRLPRSRPSSWVSLLRTTIPSQHHCSVNIPRTVRRP